MKTTGTYEVMLRRDVQQVTCVRVEASSPAEAIAVAQAVTDDDAWNVEVCIGSHKPQVKLLRAEPIRARQTSKPDRRDGTDRRATKRRLGDKSRALAAARRKKTPGSRPDDSKEMSS